MIFKRYEMKYLIHRTQRDIICRAMEPYMVSDRYGYSSIRNLYYDTPNFRLIRESLDRPVYKEKLRIRSYSRARMDDDVFLEIKKKYESIVYKRRIAMHQQDALCCLQKEKPFPDTQIAREIQAAVRYYDELKPQVFLAYDREAFCTMDGSDFRVTFDSNIRYRTQDLCLDSEPWGSSLLDDDWILMELKISESIPLWMAALLSEQKIFKTTFSKYGTAYMHILGGHQIGVLQYA